MIVIHTDGGARGNPGPAGIGAVLIEDDQVVAEFKEYIGECTNNAAEYRALVKGLSEAKRRWGTKLKNVPVEVRMDSELIVKQLNNEYQIKEETLFPHYIEVHNLIVSSVPHARFVHVRRDANAHADRLVNEAIDAAVGK